MSTTGAISFSASSFPPFTVQSSGFHSWHHGRRVKRGLHLTSNSSTTTYDWKQTDPPPNLDCLYRPSTSPSFVRVADTTAPHRKRLVILSRDARAGKKSPCISFLRVNTTSAARTQWEIKSPRRYSSLIAQCTFTILQRPSLSTVSTHRNIHFFRIMFPYLFP